MPVQTNGEYGIVDFSSLTELFPRIPKFMDQLGLFGETFYGSSTIAQVERVEDQIDDIKATSRGGDRQFVGRESVIQRNFTHPYFTLDGKFTAQDIQDLKAYGEGDMPMTMASRVERTRGRIAKSHAVLRERARYAALKGTSYAPNFPQAQYTYATEFGVASKVKAQFTVAFADESVDPRTTIEQEARQHIQKYAGNQADSYQVIAIVGSKFFDGLKDHPKTTAAYSSYASSSEPLRNRLGGDLINRSWSTEGVTYLEDFMGVQLGEIATDEAYFLPLGIEDMFQTHYAPADHKDYANTTAQELYMFMLEGARSDKVETETSFIMVNTRPELVVNAKATFA